MKKKRKNSKNVIKETREAKITIGTGGTGGISPRVGLPFLWLEHMGITKENREIEISYSPRTKKITIRKKSSETSKDDKE